MNGIRKMLSFNHLGNLGRLANQMFQYASLKGIATNRGYDFSIPPREVFGQNDTNVKNSDVILYDVFDLEKSNNIGLVQNPMLQERVHTFDNELFVNCPDNVDLFGYYQSEKYFKNIEDDIRKDFSFRSEVMKDCRKCFVDNFGETDVISLHIRRGDYVVNPNHPVQDIEYYQKALSKLSKDIPVIVFSDDTEWCKEHEFFAPDRFFISENNGTEVDLCMMSLAQYHIIANSSFSWWGAWLAKSQKVFAPQNWFGGECVNKSVEDITFENFEFL
jgi:hypothetical protein